jgi:hypothetical protein
MNAKALSMPITWTCAGLQVTVTLATSGVKGEIQRHVAHLTLQLHIKLVQDGIEKGKQSTIDSFGAQSLIDITY